MGEALVLFCFPEQCAVCQVDQGECFTVNVDICVEGLKGAQSKESPCSKCKQRPNQCKCKIDLQINPPLLSSKKRLYRKCVLLCIPAIMWSKSALCRYSYYVHCAGTPASGF